MPSLPRIITVDPIGNISRIVRAAIDLSEYACRQVDVPSGNEALQEMQIGSANLVITALNLEDIRAFDLADQIKAINDNVAFVVLGDEDDPEMDEKEQRERGFVYLQRPLQIQLFSQVLFAGLKGSDIFEALNQAVRVGAGAQDEMGPVPTLDLDKARDIVDKLVTDLGAMSILFIGRDGEVLLERGTANYVDRDELLKALVPAMLSNIDMRDIVGGDATTLQFYDGDHRDIYTLSVGLHHLLCIVYDGEKGQREFGAVNRFGREAAKDLIPLIGPAAFFLMRQPKPEVKDDLPHRTITTPKIVLEEPEEEIMLERADEFLIPDAGTELDPLELEPISDDEFDPNFLDMLGSLDSNEAEDMFSLENLDGISLDVNPGRGLFGQDDAVDYGILGKD